LDVVVNVNEDFVCFLMGGLLEHCTQFFEVVRKLKLNWSLQWLFWRKRIEGASAGMVDVDC